MATKQEDKNRKLLEELNRTRQLMMKNSGASKPTGVSDGAQVQTTRADPRAVQLLQSLEKQSATTYIATNSQFGNLVLPVFPRFAAPPVPEDSDNKS